MHRFFVESGQIHEKEIMIMGSDVNHIKNVLRMKPQDEIVVSDGDNKEYTCRIQTMKADCIAAEILFAEESGLELSSRIYLFQGLPKNDKMELIIQKAVELGVYEIIPISTKRTVVKLDKKKEENKQKRWQAISESAAKQSKRMYIPRVSYVMNFQEALEYAGDMDLKIIPYELAENMRETKAILSGAGAGQSIGIFIGPEGGFAEEEVELAVQNAIQPITLGRRILRTETAGLAILSIIMFALEE